MTVVRAAIEIAAPPQAVWDVIMDPHRFADWVTIHRRLHRSDAGELRVGFRVDQTLALAGAPFKVRWHLAQLEPPALGVWEGRGPAGSHARIVDRLAPVDGGAGTRLEYLNEYTNPGGLIGRVAGRVLVSGLAEREAARSLERLKALMEAA
jgi:carbon monoxide dehydrogenase subunit G